MTGVFAAIGGYTMDCLRNLAFMLALPALSGCATVGTKDVSRTGDTGGEGIEYFLPTGQFQLMAYEQDDGSITVALGGPFMAQDYTGRLRSKLLPGALADNDFDVAVGANGLLTTFAGNSEGKLTEIVENAVKSAIAIQSGGVAAEPFFKDRYTFDQAAHATRRVNAAIVARINAICAAAAQNDSRCTALRSGLRDDRFVTVTVNDAADEAGAETGSEKPQAPALNSPATGAFAPVANLASATGRRASCTSDALCYHPLAPVRVTLALNDGTSKTDAFLVPDKSRLSFVRAPGGLFAKQEYDFGFTDGVLTKYNRISRSEVVGLVSLPLTVAKAILSAPFDAFTDRKKALDAQTAYLEAVRNNADAREQTQESCSNRPDLCAGYVYRIISVGSAPAAIVENRVDGDGDGEDPTQ